MNSGRSSPAARSRRSGSSYWPPRLVVRWSISVVSWFATESSCDTFTASVPFLPAARPVICRLPMFTSPADDCGLLRPYAT